MYELPDHIFKGLIKLLDQATSYFHMVEGMPEGLVSCLLLRVIPEGNSTKRWGLGPCLLDMKLTSTAYATTSQAMLHTSHTILHFSYSPSFSFLVI